MLNSAIRGTAVKPVLPVTPGSPSPVDAVDRDFDVLFTAETHNFPCAVSFYSCLSILEEQFAIWLNNGGGKYAVVVGVGWFVCSFDSRKHIESKLLGVILCHFIFFRLLWIHITTKYMIWLFQSLLVYILWYLCSFHMGYFLYMCDFVFCDYSSFTCCGSLTNVFFLFEYAGCSISRCWNWGWRSHSWYSCNRNWFTDRSSHCGILCWKSSGVLKLLCNFCAFDLGYKHMIYIDFSSLGIILQMEGSYAPWEDSSFVYPPNLASPLQVHTSCFWEV